MKFSLHKDFCVWLVSPSDGKVRKLRFSLFRAIGFSFCAALVLGSFLYIAGDYTRMQIAKAKQHFSLRRLASERDALKEANRSLSQNMEALKSDNLKAANYEKTIRERLSELAALVDSVASMGILKRDPRASRPTKLSRNQKAKKAGVGGAELDFCMLQDQDCLRDSMAYGWDGGGPKASLRPDFGGLNLDRVEKQDVVALLEGYIDLLRAVPVGMPAAARVNSRFGMRFSPFGGRVRMHQGVDLDGDHGDPVWSTADGVVSQVKRNHTYGLMVDVRHPNNVTTRYAHLSLSRVAVGQRVRRGERVGDMGSTGRSTGPHLHYEVRVGGRAKNPVRLMELGVKLQKAVHQILL